MNINQLLRGMRCGCGREHTCPIEAVYIEPGAANRLKNLCPERRVLLVADENTFAAAGAQTLAALEGKDLRQVIFSGQRLLVPDEAAIGQTEERLKDTEVILGVGSGVIQDLCKYVAHKHHLPYLVVATAPSMDGYASTGAAMITNGMKETYAAGLPRAILADSDVLASAPMDMIRAGYGDIIGKFSALNDWKLSRLVTGEYFCDTIYSLTFEQITQTLSLAEGLMRRERRSVEALMEALVTVGILMSFAGSSRPASGSEHHLSHYFEITGILNHTDYFAHGIDVAYSTVVTAALRESLTEKPFPKALYRPSPEAYAAKMKEIYLTSAEGCMALQNKMGRYENHTLRMYADHEDAIRAILREMPTAAQIEGMLAVVGLPMDRFYAHYGESKIRDALLYAKDLKDRYTVLWMNYDLFGE